MSTVHAEIISVIKNGLSFSGQIILLANFLANGLPTKTDTTKTTIHIYAVSLNTSKNTVLSMLDNPPGIETYPAFIAVLYTPIPNSISIDIKIPNTTPCPFVFGIKSPFLSKK